MANSVLTTLLVAQAWQITVLIVAVAAVNRWLAKSRPHLAHALWLVVLVKCVTPPLWSSHSGVFCWLQPSREAAQQHSIVVEPTSRSWSELLESSSNVDQSLAFEAIDHGVLESGDESVESLLGISDASFAEARPARVKPVAEWPGVLIGLWCLVSLGVIGVAILRCLGCWRMVRRAPQRECSELSKELASLTKQLRLRRRVRLVVTESRIGPAVIGLFRTTVLLPALIVDRLSQRRPVVESSPVAPRQESRTSFDPHSSNEFASQLRDGNPVAERQGYIRQGYGPLTPILAHELLHIRRGDLWVGLLQTLAQAVWWCHPLVWWVNRRTTREAERCCDEEVLAELGCDAAAYARALVDVLELKRDLKPVPVFPGVRSVDVTSQRLERIMQLGQGCQRRTPWWCWLLAGLAAAATWPGAAFVVTAEDPGERGGVSPPMISPKPPNRGADAAPLTDSISSPTIESRIVHGVGVSSNTGITGKVMFESDGENTEAVQIGPTPIAWPTKQVLLSLHIYEVDEDGLKELGIKLGRAKTTRDGLKPRTVAQFQVDRDTLVKLAAMERGERAKVVSSPSIATQSRNTVSFMSDVEFAMPMVVGVDESMKTETSFRGFGLQITARPTVLANDLVSISVTLSDSTVANEKNFGVLTGVPTLVSQSVQAEVLAKPNVPFLFGPIGEPDEKRMRLIATLSASLVEPKKDAKASDRQSLPAVRMIGRPDVYVLGAVPMAAALQSEKLVSVNLENVPLKEAIKQLAQSTGRNIVLDKPGLEDESLTERVPITLALDDVKLSSALNLMLDPLNLGYRIEESGVIVVTSKERLKGQPIIVTYSVADLTVPIPKRASIKLDSRLEPADEASKANDKTAERAKETQAQFQALIDLIASTCQPNSWEAVGGNGQIKANDSMLSLVVRQTADVHAEIRDLLEQLRRLQDLQASLHIETLTVPADFWQQVGKDFDVPEANGQPNPQPQGKSAPQSIARLTKKEAALLRSLGRPESAPKVTLFNGQELEIVFGGKSPTMRLGLKPVLSGDRQGLKLQAAATKPDVELDFGKLAAVPLESGHSLLLDVTEIDSAGATTGVPTLSKVPHVERLFQHTGKSDRRTLLLVTGTVVIADEEEVR